MLFQEEDKKGKKEYLNWAYNFLEMNKQQYLM